jgi:hypothetical protein
MCANTFKRQASENASALNEQPNTKVLFGSILFIWRDEQQKRPSITFRTANVDTIAI